MNRLGIFLINNKNKPTFIINSVAINNALKNCGWFEIMIENIGSVIARIKVFFFEVKINPKTMAILIGSR
jgi:hypothetical protein